MCGGSQSSSQAGAVTQTSRSNELTDGDKRMIEIRVREIFLRLNSVADVKRDLSTMKWAELGIDKGKSNQASAFAMRALTDLQNRGLGEIRDLGYAVLSVATESESTLAGYRALDAVARILSKIYTEETCIAVCIEPRYQTSLVIASNGQGLDADAVKAKLRGELLEGISLESSTQTVRQNGGELRSLSSQRSNLTRTGRDRYLDLRYDRDKLKVQTALNNILKLLRVVVVKSSAKDAHAELQILDYVEGTIFRVGGEARQLPLYIGVSLRCCGKCHTVINAYNSCGFNHTRVMTRGVHPTYDAGGWRCPDSLVRLISASDSSFRQLSEILQYAKQDAQRGHPMSAELSDSEDEYVSSRHKA